MLCREATLVKDTETGFYATPLCCRSWTCDYCRPERRARVAYQAARGKPDTFLTLTTNPAQGTHPAQRAAALVVAWRNFVRYAKQLYGYPTIPYFAVFEATKAGQPHLHILCRVKWLDQRILSRFMKGAINAPIVDIRRANSTRAAARYVAKYVGKAPGKFGTCKRYWQTRDYQLEDGLPETPNDFAGGGWRIVHEHIDQLILHHTVHKHHVEKVGPIWIVRTHDPPEASKQARK